MITELNEQANGLRTRPIGRGDGAVARRAHAFQAAGHLLARQLWWAQVYRLLARLRRQTVGLARLPSQQQLPLLSSHRLAGIQAVPVQRIRGSENRARDFDAEFRPLADRTSDRWVNIATHYLLGESLPPVTLIQIGEAYYVRDGHHRVSVARALGYTHVEAEVVLWSVAPAARPSAAAGEARHPALDGASPC